MEEASTQEPSARAKAGEAARLARIAAGDADAFAAWLREAEPRLRASLRSFATQVDVEAVVQETLLRAWQLAPRVEVDGRGESLLRVAIRVGRNLAIDEARRARSVSLPSVEEDEDPPRPPDPFLRARIERCRGELPKKPGLALAARLAHGGRRAEAEIAKELGMRTNTYLQNLARARRFLLDCLERLGVPRAEVTS